MDPVATEKSTQLDQEMGLEKGAEGLPAVFKTQVHQWFIDYPDPKVADFASLYGNLVKGNTPIGGRYTMRGKALSADDFNAAVPNDQSLARVINIDGTFKNAFNAADAKAASSSSSARLSCRR